MTLLRFQLALLCAGALAACARDASRAADSSHAAATAPAASAPAATPVATPAPAVATDSPALAAAPASAAAHPHAVVGRNTRRPMATGHADIDLHALVDALSAWDVEEARLAMQKASQPDVKRFANELTSSHSQKVADLSVPSIDADASELLRPLRDEEQAAVARLAGVPAGPAFDRAFVAAQVELHEHVRTALGQIAPHVRTKDLTALLDRTNTQVAHHLDEARALQRRLP